MTTYDDIYIDICNALDWVQELKGVLQSMNTTKEQAAIVSNVLEIADELAAKLARTRERASRASNRRYERTSPEYLERLERQVKAQKILLDKCQSGNKVFQEAHEPLPQG
ncbi:MAG: hypothetical protein ACI3V0_08500 [Faecousia sp.]